MAIEVDISRGTLARLGSSRVVKLVSHPGGASAPAPQPMVIGGHDAPAIAAHHATLCGDVHPLGLYLVQDGSAYGDVFLEADGRILGMPDVMLPYVKSMMDSGVISIDSHRGMRAGIRTVEGACAFFSSVAPTVYGHWLVDIWPRAWLLAKIAPALVGDLAVALPDTAPAWATEVLCRRFGYRADNVILYGAETERCSAKQFVVPTYLHANFVFHPAFLDFIDDTRRQARASAKAATHGERIYLSRRAYRDRTMSTRRTLVDEDGIEDAFTAAGFTVVQPETLSFEEQVSLCAGAKVIAGEGGSALHNAMFAEPGASILSLDVNYLQGSLAALCRHRLVIVLPEYRDQRVGVTALRFDLGRIGQGIAAAVRA